MKAVDQGITLEYGQDYKVPSRIIPKNAAAKKHFLHLEKQLNRLLGSTGRVKDDGVLDAQTQTGLRALKGQLGKDDDAVQVLASSTQMMAFHAVTLDKMLSKAANRALITRMAPIALVGLGALIFFGRKR